ncbi:hypothetical protein DY218_27415 [Streptomyces triticagri]|uniref:DUF2958 domain-containing protein n=1 Tax=Streptomyces triticagri TaxID=2293568 RepID=A0A372LYK0_9ACTN|nr:hypothetical protein [Streptomyces triticagri]RFU83639.1 hypothetical protein DY218_27415 [Streptomyces triticagri]
MATNTPMPEVHRRLRGHAFYPTAAERRRLPALHATDGQGLAHVTVQVHYFNASSDLWITEYDPATGEAFGFGMVGHSDSAHGDWGYFDLPTYESHAPRRVGELFERDLHFTPAAARDVLPDGAIRDGSTPDE